MIKMNKKNIVAGLGEIGTPILKLLSENELAIGYDINENLINKAIFQDDTNRQDVAIILKSRVHSDEYIDLDKIWNLMLI